MKTIALCCPGEGFSSRWTQSFANTLLHIVTNFELAVIPPFFEFCTDPWKVRNVIAAEVIKAKADYALWIDDDNPFVPDRFERLWTALHKQADAAAVAGWCWCETDQYETGAFVSCGTFRRNWTCQPFEAKELVGQRELKQVDYTGFPAILMHAQALQDAGPNPFAPYFDQVFDGGYSGEDYGFCRRLKERGQKIYVDPLCQVPHLKLRQLAPSLLMQIEKECAA